MRLRRDIKCLQSSFDQMPTESETCQVNPSYMYSKMSTKNLFLEGCASLFTVTRLQEKAMFYWVI